MICFVNAKINLGLNIVRKRTDGYHDLETLFYPVGVYNGTPQNPQPFCDILEINVMENADADSFLFTGRPVDCPLEKNLVFRALSEFRSALRKKGIPSPYFRIILDKHLPDGAGLGGGSADASFTLKELNALIKHPLTSDELKALALRLGADCPFFIENRPMFASGVGEIMYPSSLSLEGYWAVIVKPEIYVSTREAFSGITPRLPERPIPEIVKAPVDRWEAEGLTNDFEAHIFRLHPRLAEIKSRLKDAGALYAAMSGSGSSIFGIFPDNISATQALTVFTPPNDFGCKSYLIKL